MEKINFIEKEDRPWGRFYVIDNQSNYKIKRIEVEPGHQLSYQFHNKRSEAWTIIEGSGLVTLNDKKILFKKGDTITIPIKSKHRIHNNSNSKLIFIEVQTGSYFGEDDIIRIVDDYNRI